MAQVHTRKAFQLWHSLVGGIVLIYAETLLLKFLPALSDWIICLCAIAGSIAALYIATEVIEEVRGARHMLELLSVVVGEFVIFFAAQYAFMQYFDPQSFPSLPNDPVSFALHSTMVFVFNPLWLPQDGDGRILLFINTLAALGLVLFVLQNVWQFRRN
jgi:hypothetical protein